VRDLVALTVPVVVLTARRAWAVTEAAYARGFESPRRRPFRRLAMGRVDWLLLVGTLAISAGLLFWR
jgi:energy-coupling factor transporter transmembrane protein EcfT